MTVFVLHQAAKRWVRKQLMYKNYSFFSHVFFIPSLNEYLLQVNALLDVDHYAVMIDQFIS